MSAFNLSDLPVFNPAWFERNNSQNETHQDIKLNPTILNKLKSFGPAIEGKGGDNLTYKVACYLVRDCGLNKSMALSYLKVWNNENSPPWDDSELLQKIENAESYGENNISKKNLLSLVPADKLIQEPPEEIAWLLEGILTATGTSILVSKPKIGKTTFSRQLAVSISSGNAFLNRNTKKGPVFYIAIEENREQFKKSLLHYDPSLIENLHIHSGPVPTDLLTQIEDYATTLKPVLIIIDTLIRAVNVTDTNSYGEMSKAMEPFQSLAIKHNCHVLLVHHAGKVEREHGDSVLGSTAIFGSVDTLLLLERKKDQKNYIRTIQRYGESLEPHLLDFDKESKTIKIGESSENIQRVNLDERILSFLKIKGVAVSEIEIHENVSGHKKAVGHAIRRLVAETKIFRSGSGKKSDPYLYSQADF